MFFPILFGIVACLFLLLKLPLSAISLSDTNVYISMAQHLLEGKLLYKDMFLTNLPFFPYLSVLYLTLTKSHLTWFYSTVLFEALATAVLLYLIVQKKGRPRSIAVMVASSYLFSMIVLATTDHQTGIFFGTLMATLGYYLYQKKQFSYAGVALGLMFVTKGYTLPLLGAFFIYDMYMRRKQAWTLIVPACLAIFAVLLPSLIYARGEMISNIFGYTLNRPIGLDKWNVFRFFIVNQWLLCIAAIYSFITFRKNVLVAVLIAGGILFLLIYQDIYFFYFNMLVPFMCIALADGVEFLSKKIGRLNGLLIATLLISLSMILNYKTYMEALAPLQKIQDISKLTSVIQKEKPEFIFGAVELTPVLSYLTETPLLDGLIDTNESLFVRKVYNLQNIKKDIFAHKTMVVTLGVDRAAQTADGKTVKLLMPVIPELYKGLDIEKRCKQVVSQPVVAEGYVNRINLWKCY